MVHMDGQTDGFATTISRSPWIGMLTRYKKKDLKLQRITNVTILLMIFSQINLVQSPSKNMTHLTCILKTVWGCFNDSAREIVFSDISRMIIASSSFNETLFKNKATATVAESYKSASLFRPVDGSDVRDILPVTTQRDVGRSASVRRRSLDVVGLAARRL